MANYIYTTTGYNTHSSPYIMLYMDFTQPQEICILQGRMEDPLANYPSKPVSLKVNEAILSADIDAELVCPLRTAHFLLGTHGYDTKRHNFIGGVSQCMSTREESQPNSVNIGLLKYNMMKSTLKWIKGGGLQQSSTAISRMARRLATSCQKDPRVTVAQATAITPPLDYNWHMDFVQHDVVDYSASMSWLQTTEGEDTENLLIAISWTSSGPPRAKSLWYWR